MSAARERAERLGAGHRHATMLEARRRTIAAVAGIARRVAPGMTEEEGLALARHALREHGFEQHWTEPYLRFGSNTRKRFGEPSEPGVVLRRDDLWYIDVGPLWDSHECDFADTFAVGDDPEHRRLVRDLHAVFDGTVAHWRASRATGIELYRHASAEATSRGWQLDAGMAGHRVGLHPHGYDGTLAQADFTPSPGLWMLEILLRHPHRPCAAFFEDLLLDAADE